MNHHPPEDDREPGQPRGRPPATLGMTTNSRHDGSTDGDERSTLGRRPKIDLGRLEGLTLGNYVILGKLGSGGMGSVYRARHTQMDRPVALKILSGRAVIRDVSIRRFRREVVAAAKLVHPNVVAAYDAGEVDGIPYLVMELVDGIDLAKLVVASGPLDWETAVDYLIQAAEGLHDAHCRGVIHRDIKPSNLLVDVRGTVKVLDLGLARIEERLGDSSETHALTETGQVIGTVDYMAPEQAEDIRRADARSDVYSLGCTLHFLLKGEAVFPAESLTGKLLAHRECPVPELGEGTNRIPVGLENVFRRMLAKRPQDRHQAMAEVIADLRAILGNSRPLPRPHPAGLSMAGTIDAKPPADTAHPDALDTKRDAVSVPTTPDGAVSGADPSGSVGRNPPMPVPRSIRWGEAAKGRWPKRVLAVALALAGFVAVIPRWGTVSDTARDTGTRRIDHGSPPDVMLADDSSPSSGATRPEPPNAIFSWAGILAVHAPLPAVAPMTPGEAQQCQQAWAEFMGLPVEVTLWLPGDIPLAMMVIPPGEFTMGSGQAEQERFIELAKPYRDRFAAFRIRSEGPAKRVQITKPFLLGKREVTQDQWLALMPKNPSRFQDSGELPVERVRWDQAQQFAEKLRSTVGDGWHFELPTEAQWEYACRAGSTSAWHFGDSLEDLERYAWVDQGPKGRSRPSGTLLPNAWGLYDMHGNVQEWCADRYDHAYYSRADPIDPKGPESGDTRVFRGGEWHRNATISRSASRFNHAPDLEWHALGLRVMAIPPVTSPVP